MRVAFSMLVLILALLGAPASAPAEPPPEGTVWTEAYFPSGDGTMLHADVLRPAQLPPDAKTPVLLTVSPYTGHAEGQAGPSARFSDFTVPAQIWARGYTYVIVDLRGFGGSAGCNDWGGPGERMDAKAAVEWAAAQPWSTGRVGMVGKSYDGWTGLMAIAERAKGLAAVLSMEPVYSGYRYLYMDGVRFANSVATPLAFTATDAAPGGTPEDTVTYHVNGTSPNAGCYAANVGQQQLDDPTEPFWRARDLLRAARGATTPLFLTQGFLERNTKPDGAFEFYNGMAGPKRAWFGQFDHVRGWEVSEDGELQTGRAGFIEEVMRFFDRHVKGAPAGSAATELDPPVAVQDAAGRYRAERTWPPADVVMRTSPLNAGTYEDDGANHGASGGGLPPGGPAPTGQGIWTVSTPLPHDAHLAGEPVVGLSVTATAPRANLVVDVYDIAPDRRATLISRGATLVREPGTVEARPEMYGQDWPLAAGHRVGVLVTGANADWWEHVPTRQTVTVNGGTIGLPFLRDARTSFLTGVATPRLRAHHESAPFELAAATIAEATAAFDLPPALRRPPAPGAGPQRRIVPRRTLTVRARRRGHTVTVDGTTCVGDRVEVTLLSGRRALARRRHVTLNGGCRRYRVRLRTSARRRLTVRVVARGRGHAPARRAARVR